MSTVKNKNTKWWVGMMACLLLFLVIGVFGYNKMIFVFRGIDIQASLEQKEIGTNIFEIKGLVPTASYVSLNGREIFINKEGQFSESIAILPGFSVITINTRDKFGKIKEKKFEIVREEGKPAVAMLDANGLDANYE
jgi:hypothetical protein